MAIDTKRAIRRMLEEAYGKGDVGVYDELCDPSFRDHDPVAGDCGLARAKENCLMYRAAFPDLKATVLACCAEGDTAVAHWRMTGTQQQALFGIAPTGKKCTVEGITIGRFRRGKLMENWTQWDALGLMRQLGAAAGAGAGAGARTAESRPRASH